MPQTSSDKLRQTTDEMQVISLFYLALIHVYLRTLNHETGLKLATAVATASIASGQEGGLSEGQAAMPFY